MDSIKNLKFRFNGFTIVKSYFECGNNADDKAFTIAFDPKGIIDDENSIFELQFNVQITNNTKDINIEVHSLGRFEFDKNEDMGQLNSYFYLNAPAIMFPYIRAYISSMTALSGIRTVVIPTMNLIGLQEDLKKNTVKKGLEE